MNFLRYSFLHFLSDNLSGLTLHNIRRDAEDPSADALGMNAINVHFLNINIGGALESQQVAIDVVYDDETTCVDNVAAVGRLLTLTHFTALKDYTDPETPVPLGGNLTWGDPSFIRVASDFYCHYACTLTLRSHTT